MSFAQTRTIALEGAVGHLVDVQVDVSYGIVGTVIVGNAGQSLTEARDRVRMAVLNSDLPWPTAKRTTVILSPGDLPKSGTHLDLAIAVCVLAATDELPRVSLNHTVFLGELGLAGALRPVQGILPMVLAAAEHGIRRVFVPEPHVAEASLVPGMSVIGMRSLAQVVAELRGHAVPEAPPVVGESGSSLVAWRGEDRLEDTDLADVAGMQDARFAVEVAAAGAHHLMLTGPKGAGKTTIAERIPGLLPDLDPEVALELTALQSLAGELDVGAGLARRPPFSAPHHDATKASILGGGTGRVRPGQVSLTHGGVLFLDEFPLFRTDVIDGLRQPLESGDVVIARREETVRLPARPLVVLACNPCPCGNYTAQGGSQNCDCTELRRRDYRARITGPVADRIDIVRAVEPITAADLEDRFAARESSAMVAARVTRARERQHERFAGRAWRVNAHAPGPELRRTWPLTDRATSALDGELLSGRLTHRGAVRVHRLAWTVADLFGVDRPGPDELQVALRLRTGRPLDSATVERRAG